MTESVTRSRNGSFFHIQLTENFLSVQGVGQTTGAIYQLPAALSESENLTAGQEETKR